MFIIINRIHFSRTVPSVIYQQIFRTEIYVHFKKESTFYCVRIDQFPLYIVFIIGLSQTYRYETTKMKYESDF